MFIIPKYNYREPLDLPLHYTLPLSADNVNLHSGLLADIHAVPGLCVADNAALSLHLPV
jgi:hypothetical protein